MGVGVSLFRWLQGCHNWLGHVPEGRTGPSSGRQRRQLGLEEVSGSLCVWPGTLPAVCFPEGVSGQGLARWPL